MRLPDAIDYPPIPLEIQRELIAAREPDPQPEWWEHRAIFVQGPVRVPMACECALCWPLKLKRWRTK